MTVITKAKWYKLPIEICYYCGKSVRIQGLNQPWSATIDHMVPVSRGGKSVRGNMVLSCYPCNREKASLTLEEFRALTAFRKNAVNILPVKIFAGENWVPPKLPMLTYPKSERKYTTFLQFAATVVMLWIVKTRCTLSIFG